MRSGGGFFALPGARVDGHAYVADAARAGAVVAIIARTPPGTGPFPPAMIRVDDVAAALARSGAFARQRIRGKVIAITGSAGKTTTKEFVAAGLQASLSVHRTKGNLNNELGLPLSILSCPDDAEAAVFEMGMNGPGQIAFLARLADPDVGLVTNVLPVHLEFFDSVDDIAAAKGELFAVLREDATSVVNLDDDNVRVQAARHAGPRVTFGRADHADLKLLVDRGPLRPRRRIDLRARGAIAHARAQGRRRPCGPQRAGRGRGRRRLRPAARTRARGDRRRRGRAGARPADPASREDVVVVDDTYNSNPEALASVLGTLKASTPAGRRVLVMGDMLELRLALRRVPQGRGRARGRFRRRASRRRRSARAPRRRRGESVWESRARSSATPSTRRRRFPS